MTTTMTTADEAAAITRVQSSPALSAILPLLLEYDWSNRDEHLVWVANAPEAEILDWAKSAGTEEDV